MTIIQINMFLLHNSMDVKLAFLLGNLFLLWSSSRKLGTVWLHKSQFEKGVKVKKRWMWLLGGWKYFSITYVWLKFATFIWFDLIEWAHWWWSHPFQWHHYCCVYSLLSEETVIRSHKQLLLMTYQEIQWFSKGDPCSNTPFWK